ncbi:MAG: hypothetical protein LBO00_07545 [Zoogloeaceae bacterium]|jgi:hypothetical protein|nr:hypothetical protein [Zoogloeaceae bacterium]
MSSLPKPCAMPPPAEGLYHGVMRDGFCATPLVSEIHLANFRADAKRAATLAELRQMADKHAPFLIGKHREEARRVYLARRQQFGGNAS